MSHHQAIQRTKPRHITYWSAYWDPKSLQWVVKLMAMVLQSYLKYSYYSKGKVIPLDVRCGPEGG